MNAGNNITQTLSAESGVKNYAFPQMRFKESKAAFDSQAYAYYPELTEDKISHQSADQLPWFHINPVEFYGIRIQAELWNLALKKETQK